MLGLALSSPQEEKMEALLDIRRAAEILSLSHWTLRSYLRAGRLRPLRIGKRVLIEPDELRRFIAGCRATGTPSLTKDGKETQDE